MITVIHGDNTVKSRDSLHQRIQHHKQKADIEILRLDGKKINITDLTQALETVSLFGGDRLVVIEKLLTRQTSKEKKALLNKLKDSQSFEQTPEIIIWEDKKVTATQLKPLGNVQNNESKISKQLFTFLDSLRPGNATQSLELFNQTLEQDAAELVFAMLVRQVRLLLHLKLNVPTKLAPWQRTKLSKQASTFQESQLRKLHQGLLQIDYGIKTGSTKLKLRSLLDITIINI